MKLKDEHVKLDGFLEGWPHYPFVWSKVSLESNLTPQEWESIELYKYRAREFLNNLEDLGSPGRLELSINSIGEKAKIGTNVYPDKYRAKAVYLDFRHFIANDEPTNFYRINNILKNNINKNHEIHIYLRMLKEQFILREELGLQIEGHSFSNKELIKLWFNTEFFHSGKDPQKKKRREWLLKIEEKGIHNLLFFIIKMSENSVKGLYACLKDLQENICHEVNCPDKKALTN